MVIAHSEFQAGRLGELEDATFNGIQAVRQPRGIEIDPVEPTANPCELLVHLAFKCRKVILGCGLSKSLADHEGQVFHCFLWHDSYNTNR